MASFHSFVSSLLLLLLALSSTSNGYSARYAATLRRTAEDVELTKFFTGLWNGDAGRVRLQEGGGREDPIRIDVGGKTNPNDRVDEAPRKLFQFVNEGQIFSHPSTAALLQLHDDYQPRASVAEDQERNHHELEEINNFLNLVINTPTMQRANSFLQRSGLLTNQSLSWRRLLRHIWFDLYSRHRGVMGSSGFEHVFLGEIDDGKVKGVHNWIWFYKMEKRGLIDYQGYLAQPTGNPILLSNRFNWPFENHIYRKPQTSFMLGSTPEFDMALFTVCFLKHPNGVSKFKINGTTFMVQTWKNQDGTLGSAYFLG